MVAARRIGITAGRMGSSGRRLGARRELWTWFEPRLTAQFGAASAAPRCWRKAARELAFGPMFWACVHERVRNSGVAPV